MLFILLTQAIFGQMQQDDSTAIHRNYMLQLQEQQLQSDIGSSILATVALPTTYNWYVAITGNDANPGTEIAPLRTIQAAINRSSTGQTIKVADGHYVECISFSGKSIKLVGNPNSPHSVIIDGNSQNATVRMTQKESSTTLLCGFTITGGSGHLVHLQSGGGIHLYDNANPVLSDLIITGNQASNAAALGALHGSAPVVQNTLVYENITLSANYTVRFHNMVSGAAMYNVTIVDNTGALSTVGVTRGSHLTVKNSIIRNHSSTYEAFMSSDNGSMNSIAIDYSNLRGGTSLLYTVSDQGTYNLGSGIIDVTPGFLNPASGNYQLLEGSPCIDAGDPVTMWDDVNFPPSRGTSRNDMGTYGWQVSEQPYQTESENYIKYSYDNSGNRTARRLIQVSSMLPSVLKSYSIGEIGTLADDYFSKPTTEHAEEILNGHEVIIYPNPTTGNIRIDIKGTEMPERSAITIYNISGGILEQAEHISETTSMDISSYPSGIYIMRIVLGEEVSVWRIIKR